MDIKVYFENATGEEILSSSIVSAKAFFEDEDPYALQHGIISKDTATVATNNRIDPEVKKTIHFIGEVSNDHKEKPYEIELYFNNQFYYLKVEPE